MIKGLGHSLKLARGFWILGRTGAGLPSVLSQALPLPLRLILPKRHRASAKQPAPLAMAFSKLGPTYIKLGQFLAVRVDILDKAYVDDLGHLHDRLPPFPQSQAQKIIGEAFPDNPFTTFSEPIAAASIAQVHKARGRDGKYYAVKILRPNIEKKFNADMADLFWAGKKLERYLPSARRLRPLAALKNLEQTTKREMDLRFEAASMSELRKNSKDLKGFYIPKPEWQWTRQNILTMEWIDGIKISERDKLAQAGHNLAELAENLLHGFLSHALYDGFFHADFHPGNLFVRADGLIVPIDFGITARLPERDRRAMAWILRAFLEGNYELAAQQHIDVGYVPRDTDCAQFSQALRAIGEPILDKSAADISMAQLLWQLFETAASFEMETQPQLLLLQKTMLAAEGLARALNPRLNIWQVASPIVENWMKREYAPDRVLGQVFKLGQRLWQNGPDLLDEILALSSPPPNSAPSEGVSKPKKPRFLWSLLFGFILGAGVFILLTKFYPNYSFFM